MGGGQFVPRRPVGGNRRRQQQQQWGGLKGSDLNASTANNGAMLPEEVEEMRRAVERMHGGLRGAVSSGAQVETGKYAAQASVYDASTTDSLPFVDDSSEKSSDGFYPATPDFTPRHSPRSSMSSGGNAGAATFSPLNSQQVFNSSLKHAAGATFFAGTADATVQSTPSTEETDKDGSDAIMTQLVGDDLDARNAILESVVTNLWSLSATPGGCRLVQKAFELADVSSQVAMAEQLHGRVLEAAASPHANHVLQKCIATLPTEHINFVLEEVTGNAVIVARHRYGCRVLERLIEHFPRARVEHIVVEVLDEVEKLCRHAFGNFVIQHIMEHGTDLHRQQVSNVLCTDAVRFAKHRVASHVVKAALLHCERSDKARLVQALCADAAELSNLAHHHCGSFVVRELRRTNDIRR